MTIKLTLHRILILGLFLLCGWGSIPAWAADTQESHQALQELKKWLALPHADRTPVTEQPFARTALTRPDAAQAQKLLWQDQVTDLKKSAASQWENKKIQIDNWEMKFDYRTFGAKPTDGWSLYISLHGGGGAPPQVNDSQWKNQINLYKPKEGIYLAPRAPTDTWNLWHQSHIDPLFDQLITTGIVYMDVNPNRVYLMGYSAGGDGVYQLAPRMADRWAAAAMMSGHPNEASPLGLRNIGFTIHAGQTDSAYNRNGVAAQWKRKLKTLRQQDPNGYVHEVHIHPGLGHWMNLKDAVAVDWMAGFTRNPLPDKIVWYQDDVTHDRFYWLAVPAGQAKPNHLVIAQRKDQTIHILKATGSETLILLLNDQMMNLDKPITVHNHEKTIFQGTPTRTIATLHRTITERKDPQLIFSAELTLILPQKNQ